MQSLSSKLWLLALVSGVMQVLIFPSPSWTALVWVAIAPLLRALVDERVQQAKSFWQSGFWLGYLSGLIWYAGTCFWIYHSMHVYGYLSPTASVLIVIGFCSYLGLYHGIFGWLVLRVARKNGTNAALWVAPFLWVGVELARYHITGFPWDLLGTAVVDNIPLTRIAPATGVWGLSFLIVAVNAIWAAAWVKNSFNLAGAALATSIVCSAGLLYRPAASVSTDSALLVQQNLPILDSGWSAEYFDNTMAELVNLSRTAHSASGQKNGLIIWPESPAPFFVNDLKFHSWLSTLASDANSYVIVGSLGTGREREEIFNSATLVAPSGSFLARYDKIRLVPFGEYIPFEKLLFFAKSLTKEVSTFSRGKDRVVFKLGDGHTASAFICYESVFPDEVRQFAANGAQLFMNISNDGWFGNYGAPGQHLNMARMRAIENKRWLLRATNTGITSAIDPYGRVVAEAERNVRTTLNAPFAYISESTFYTRHGDWFAWVCAIISLLACVVKHSLVVRGKMFRSSLPVRSP